jgi:hypothetical protein
VIKAVTKRLIISPKIFDSSFKKWAAFSIFCFFLLSLNDYSIYVLSIPPLNELEISEGQVKIKLDRGRRRTSEDKFFLLEKNKLNRYSCRISTSGSSNNASSCIQKGDSRFYSREDLGVNLYGVKRIKIKPKEKAETGKVWWYEVSIFGPFKHRLLLQLDVAGTRIIRYEQQKNKYLSQKNSHTYVSTILMVASIIYFFVLQFWKVTAISNNT